MAVTRAARKKKVASIGVYVAESERERSGSNTATCEAFNYGRDKSTSCSHHARWFYLEI